MILITGGAGFIGSIVQAEIAASGRETIVSDWLGRDAKWRNLARHPPQEIVAPENLDAFLARDPPLAGIVHLGAISETTATDGDLTWATNVALSQRLWHWCAARRVPFVYASSAATYGDGSRGFDDDGSVAHLTTLRPLNLYGWTKHAFDLWVARQVESGAKSPPHWAGLKFFNVFGPNEYHKGPMISVVKVKYDEVRQGLLPSLFRADRPDIADGHQRRDFIWVNDTVSVLLWLLETPAASGLFNVGTGTARTYLDLAHAVCAACGREPGVTFIDMPASLRGQYQSFTKADMRRLRAAGYDRPFTSLEDGVAHYVRDYLATDHPYR
jgi:ADP-L-glycero-D-manno-heptose 6-epimerase